MFYVYILECSDGRHYTGMTNNLKRRLLEHSHGSTQTTRCRLPIELVFYSAFIEQGDAIKFEKYLKTHSGREFRDKHLLPNRVRI